MDNIIAFIIENKTGLLIVLAIGGSLLGLEASGSKNMSEQRALHKAPTDRLAWFRISVVFSAILVVGMLFCVLILWLYVALKPNITLLPVVLVGVTLLVACEIIFQFGVHIFQLCTWSIPSQRKIDLHHKGIEYFREGDYENAMMCFLESCNFTGIALLEGRETSECYVGRMFLEGNGVKKDPESAVKWFRKACELASFGSVKLRDPNACGWLGYCHERGYGVEKDLELAERWYKEAADCWYKVWAEDHEEDARRRFDDAKERWEKLSGELYDESETDAEEDAYGDEADDDNAVGEDEEEFDDTESETDEEEDDEDGDDEGGGEDDDDDDEEYVDPIEELNAMIGLGSVKRQVAELEDFIELQEERREKGLRVPAMSYHCVFTGNPGTGKTSVARILARIYSDMGVIDSEKLVETDRAGLVAEYEGQTAEKTNAVIDSALDGVLFIDKMTLDERPSILC